MAPIHEFCLAAVVFLSLPLPIYASLIAAELPAVSWRMRFYVWINSMAQAVFGLLIIATSVPEVAVTALAAFVFVVCGAGMFVSLARCAASSGKATAD